MDKLLILKAYNVFENALRREFLNINPIVAANYFQSIEFIDGKFTVVGFVIYGYNTPEIDEDTYMVVGWKAPLGSDKITIDEEPLNQEGFDTIDEAEEYMRDSRPHNIVEVNDLPFN